MKMIRYIVSLLAAAFVLVTPAQQVVTDLVSNTSSNLLTIPAIIDSVTFTATNATSTTIRFYDSASATNIGIAAYISYATSNYTATVTFTNENGIIITNTTVGVFTYPITNAAATNSLPTLFTIVVPGAATPQQRTRAIKAQVSRGLTAVSTGNGVIEIEYRRNP